METFKKRQKEQQRLERQRDKFARRMERKLHRNKGAEQQETPAENPEEEKPADEQPAV